MAALDDYTSFIKGTARSPGGESQPSRLKNKLVIDLTIQRITASGALDPDESHSVPAGGDQSLSAAQVGDVWVITTKATNAFVALIRIVAGVDEYEMTPSLLVPAGNLGAPPSPPPFQVAIRVPIAALVGVGVDPEKSSIVVTQEQQWFESCPPITVPASGSILHGVQEIEGVQTTSSRQSTVAESLNLKASADWGVISTELSKSIETSSTVSESINIFNQTVTVDNLTITNPDPTNAVVVFFWELRSVYRIWKSDEDGGKTTLSLKATVYDAHEPTFSVRVTQALGGATEAKMLRIRGGAETL